MKKYKFIAMFILISVLAIPGCRDSRMQSCFPENSPRILMDSQGRKWLVEHHIGDTYTICPLDDFDKIP